jgi:hypothetical protein
MSKGIRKAAGPALALALAAIGTAGCGSGGETTTQPPPAPPLSAATADHLANLSDRVASDLDNGQTCDAAYAADQLKDAVNHADLAATLRPGVEEVATQLVNDVNCPPPPPPEPEKKPKKPKKDEGDKHGPGNEQGPGDENGHDGHDNHGHPNHGGVVPPGQAKIKGEPG